MHTRYLVLRNCRGGRSLAEWLSNLAAATARFCRRRLRSASRPSQKRELTSAAAAAAPLDGSSCNGLDLLPQHCADGVQAVHADGRRPGQQGGQEDEADISTPERLASGRCRMLESQFRKSVTRARRLGSSDEVITMTALAMAPSLSIWSTPNPLLAALLRPWMPTVAALLALVHLLQLVAALRWAVAHGVAEARHFRFTALESRDGGVAHPASWADGGRPGIGDLGLLRTGLPHEDDPIGELHVANGSASLSFDRPVRIQGWWLRTADRSPDANATCFLLERPALSRTHAHAHAHAHANARMHTHTHFLLERSAHSRLGPWELLHTSQTRWTFFGSPLLLDGRMDHSLSRCPPLRFSLGPPRPCLVNTVGWPAVGLLASLVVLSATVAGRTRQARSAVLVSLLLMGLLSAGVALDYSLWEGQTDDALLALTNALILLLLALRMAAMSTEPALCLVPIAWVHAAAGAAGLGAQLVYAASLGLQDAGAVWPLLTSVAAQPCVLLWALLLLLASHSTWISRRAGRAPAPSLPSTAESCARVAARAQNRAGRKGAAGGTRAATLQARLQARWCHNLLRASALADELSVGLPADVRQLSRLASPSRVHSGTVLSPTPSGGPPIKCLDQLRARADGVDLFLRHKVQNWAMLSHGCFPVRPALDLAAAPQCGCPSRSDSDTPPGLDGSAQSSGASAAGSLPFDRDPLCPPQQSGGPSGAAVTAEELGEGRGRAGGRFRRWSELVAEGGVGQVQWARPKSITRCHYELYFAHAMDRSRLLDLCSHSIYFETPEALRRCLEHIAADPSISLLRVSNGLLQPDGSPDAAAAGALSHAAAASGGPNAAAAAAPRRNLALLLRIERDDMVELGLERHVCQVRLVLLADCERNQIDRDSEEFDFVI